MLLARNTDSRALYLSGRALALHVQALVLTVAPKKCSGSWLRPNLNFQPLWKQRTQTHHLQSPFTCVYHRHYVTVASHLS